MSITLEQFQLDSLWSQEGNVIIKIAIILVLKYARNIFNLSTSFSPFSVQPKSAYLKPGEKMDIKVGFKTMFLGTTDGILSAIFETGW